MYTSLLSSYNKSTFSFVIPRILQPILYVTRQHLRFLIEQPVCKPHIFLSPIPCSSQCGKHNWAVAWDFEQCGNLKSVDADESVQPTFKLRNSKWCSASSLKSYNIQMISKGSDQTARMRRLVWGFTGRTYHIVWNLMSWLNYKCTRNIYRGSLNLKKKGFFRNKEKLKY